MEELIADIAVIFHWPPSELYVMEIRELIDWRQRAAVRSGNDNEDNEDDQ